MNARSAPVVLLHGDESNGHVAVVALTGRGRPPLHHHDFDETFYILEGELTFQLGEKLVTRRAGELAFAPRGLPHTYANLSGAPARALMVITPAGFERYFARLAAERRGVQAPEWALQHVPEVTTVGPSLGADSLVVPTRSQRARTPRPAESRIGHSPAPAPELIDQEGERQ
jgi:quercetin dioxygenase-like cupin family protein